MEKVLITIDRLREADEGTRQRVLILTVAVVALLLGVAWAFSFRAQLTSAERAGADASAEASALPSVGELFKKGSSSLISGTKSGLKGLILGEEEAERSDVGGGSGVTEEQPKYNRLPKAE